MRAHFAMIRAHADPISRTSRPLPREIAKAGCTAGCSVWPPATRTVRAASPLPRRSRRTTGGHRTRGRALSDHRAESSSKSAHSDRSGIDGDSIGRIRSAKHEKACVTIVIDIDPARFGLGENISECFADSVSRCRSTTVFGNLCAETFRIPALPPRSSTPFETIKRSDRRARSRTHDRRVEPATASRIPDEWCSPASDG